MYFAGLGMPHVESIVIIWPADLILIELEYTRSCPLAYASRSRAQSNGSAYIGRSSRGGRCCSCHKAGGRALAACDGSSSRSCCCSRCIGCQRHSIQGAARPCMTQRASFTQLLAPYIMFLTIAAVVLRSMPDAASALCCCSC